MSGQKIVFFLGAGASKPFGIPLTSEILPNILESISKENLFKKIDDSIGGGDYSSVERREMERDLQLFLHHLMPGLQEIFKKYELQIRNKGNKSGRMDINLPLI